MKKILIIISFFGLGVFFAEAQQVTPITKAEVLIKISESNATIKISEQTYKTARANYKQTNAVFLPNITASHTGIATTNPLMAFGSKLNQEILTQNDFNPILLNNPSQIQNFSTIFEVQQPLLNMDGLYERKAAKTKMNAMALQTERTTDYITFEVEKAYMQLQLAYKGVGVIKKTLETAKAHKKLALNSLKQGYLQQADVLSVEVRVIEVKNQLQTAKSTVANASNYLSFLMNDNGYIIYKPSDSLTISSFSFKKDKEVSENRSDIRAMQLVSNAYETLHKASKMEFLPRLNAFGSYELHDDQVFKGGANGYTFGAQLSWNLFEGSKRFGKTQKSKAELEKSKLQFEQYVSQSNLEFNKAKRMLIDAENKLDLTELALEQSKESLRIRSNRYKEGLEKTSDLLASETQYAQKELEYYQTIFEYNYALSYLQFLTKN